MLILQASKAELAELNYERYNYPSALVQKRMHTIYLKCAFSYPHKEIAKILGRHPNTITRDIKRFQSKGIDGLKELNYGTNVSELAAHGHSIEAYFKENPPMSIAEAKHRIEELTSIKRSPTQIRVFMKRIGLKRLKTGQIPAKADREKQLCWLKTQYQPALKLAQNGEAHLLFMDAAHFVLAPFLCFLWCFKRIFIKGPAGRQRLNVIGAVNGLTKQIHFTSNTTQVNALTIVDFLHQIRIYYFDMKPIYIVLDNARYQHCQLVRYIAWQFNIRLLFLPPYSPNLNIIERLWKFVKKKCLYAKYYQSFQDFQNAICQTLNKANSDVNYIKELDSLLSLKFQLF
jgi:transposase